MVLLHVSASTPALPALPSLPPLGLSPADRSLLPKQRKQKFMQSKACQTDVTELAELRVMQQALSEVRKELGTMSAELSHAERRVRNEVQEEMEGRMRKFERKTKEKVDFFKKRQESSVGTIRRAVQATLVSAKAQQENDLRREFDERAAAESVEVVALRAEMQKMVLLVDGYKEESKKLREKLDSQRGGPAPKKASKVLGVEDGAPSADDAETRAAALEAQLASRDATIKALREQLARYNPAAASAADAAAGATPKPPPAQSRRGSVS